GETAGGAGSTDTDAAPPHDQAQADRDNHGPGQHCQASPQGGGPHLLQCHKGGPRQQEQALAGTHQEHQGEGQGQVVSQGSQLHLEEIHSSGMVHQQQKHMTKSLWLLLTHAFKNLNPKKTPTQFKEKIAGNSIFRDWLMRMGFRATNKYTITDPDHPNTEPGHSQRSVKWWQDINLKGACITKPRTKGSSLFKYVDFPGQIGEEIDEKEDKQVDKEEDKWVDEDKDKWVDEDEDRQEEEQVESHNTTAHSNLCLPFFPLCAGWQDW
ncbi:uncharacterized protein ACA1_326720, partial [Acanthamoeba castellanii str. Neff]